MNMPSSRKIRLALTTLGFAGLIVALSAAPAGATPGSGFGSSELGRGTNQSNGTIPISQDLDVVMTQTTVIPGGFSGWHSHPGGAIVVVAAGQITTYESVGNHCRITHYTAGQTFFERPGQPLNAKNEGGTTSTIYATFPGVPVGGSPRTSEDNPGVCPI